MLLLKLKLSFCCDFYRSDRDLSLVTAFSLETNYAVAKSEQSIVTAASYIDTRMDLGSALSVKNISGLNKLSVCSLGSQSLGLGITTVLCGTYTFLMSE
jgi:hypothetical protein